MAGLFEGGSFVRWYALDDHTPPASLRIPPLPARLGCSATYALSAVTVPMGGNCGATVARKLDDKTLLVGTEDGAFYRVTADRAELISATPTIACNKGVHYTASWIGLDHRWYLAGSSGQTAVVESVEPWSVRDLGGEVSTERIVQIRTGTVAGVLEVWGRQSARTDLPAR